MTGSLTTARSERVTRRLPRRQSLPVQVFPDRHTGQTGLGRIEVAESVLARIAARAAVEVPDVGAPSSGVLRHVGAGHPPRLGALPEARVSVDGGLAFVDLTLSVRYPVSVRTTAAAVRDRVRARLGELAGVDVPEVDITVPALVTDLAPARRVR